MVLSTPDRPSGPLLEEKNQSISHRAASTNLREVQTRDNEAIQVPQRSELLSRRTIITGDYPIGSVFERLGTRPNPPSIESCGDKVTQSKPKHPNYSRINSTIRMFQSTAPSNSQQAMQRSLYASAVKRNLNSDSGTTAQSTLKSTTDMPRQVANELNVATSSQINQEARLPFKLIPVVPPKKNEAVKSVVINVTPVVSKTTVLNQNSSRSLDLEHCPRY